MKPIYYMSVLAGGVWFGLAASLPAQTYAFGTLAGNASMLDDTGYPIGGYADGTNSDAQFNSPNGITVDAAGNVFVADTLNQAIRKVAPVGSNWVVTTIAGAGPTHPGSSDGTNSDARFNFPQGLAVDGVGNLYVADLGNNTIRKLSPVGTNWVASTIAGLAGTSGTNDGTGASARFSAPAGVAVDSAMNLYVADAIANTIRIIRPVGTNWVVSTIAGLADASGSSDGIGSSARFDGLSTIAVDSATNLFVNDYNNQTVRKITPVDANWSVCTIAGAVGATGTNDGPGTSARFANSGGLTVDSTGVIFITDNEMIRKIAPVGNQWIVSTLAGMPWPAHGTNDGVGRAARFGDPQAMTVDLAGNLYVADTDNHLVRRGQPVSTALPSLQLCCSGGQVILTWPLSAPGFVLETGNAMPARGGWTPLTNGVAISGGNYVLTNNFSTGAAFYRLHKP